VEASDLSRESFGISTQSVKQGLVEAIEAALALGEAERAAELVATIDAVPPGLRPPYLTAQADRFRARLAGAASSAAHGFVAAEQRFRSIGVVFRLAVTQLEHAEWLLGQGRSAEAVPLLAESREILGQLEATPWLDRLAGAEAALDEAGTRA